MAAVLSNAVISSMSLSAMMAQFGLVQTIQAVWWIVRTTFSQLGFFGVISMLFWCVVSGVRSFFVLVASLDFIKLLGCAWAATTSALAGCVEYFYSWNAPEAVPAPKQFWEIS